MLTHLIKQTQDLVLRSPSYDRKHLRNIERLLTDINESLDRTSFKGVIDRWNSLKETTGIKILYQAYQDLSQNILEQFNKINDDIPRRTKLRIYRVCLDGEILLEGLFSALGSECTDDMDKYKPFPYDDSSRIYEDYKKLKYNSNSISRWEGGLIGRRVGDNDMIGLIKLFEASESDPADKMPDEKKLSKKQIFYMLDNLMQSRTEPTKQEEEQLNNRSTYVSEWLKKSPYKDKFDNIFNKHMEGALSEQDINIMIEPPPFSQYITSKIIDSYIWELRQGKYKSKLDVRNYKVNIKKHPKGYRTIILDRK